MKKIITKKPVASITKGQSVSLRRDLSCFVTSSGDIISSDVIDARKVTEVSYVEKVVDGEEIGWVAFLEGLPKDAFPLRVLSVVTTRQRKICYQKNLQT